MFRLGDYTFGLLVKQIFYKYGSGVRPSWISLGDVSRGSHPTTYFAVDEYKATHTQTSCTEVREITRLGIRVGRLGEVNIQSGTV